MQETTQLLHIEQHDHPLNEKNFFFQYLDIKKSNAQDQFTAFLIKRETYPFSFCPHSDLFP